MKNKILLVGAGRMGIEYAKVLKNLDEEFVVVGRSVNSAQKFEKEIGVKVELRGLQNIDINKLGISHAINAVSVDKLAETTLQLINAGIKNILVEKPAGLNTEEILRIEDGARRAGARVLVAYNRRLYGSVQKAKEIIEADGGVLSLNFDFTEWPNTIESLPLANETKVNWVLANSSHVIDLAFFLGGKPKKIETNTGGSGALPWHPRSAIFTGSGTTESGALFSYHADWLSAGRWSVEILTKKRKLILRPLEKLFEQKVGELEAKEVPLENSFDLKFKAGVYLETKDFLNEDNNVLPEIEDHLENIKLIEKIAGYGQIL